MAAQLAASQEGLSSMSEGVSEWVAQRVSAYMAIIRSIKIVGEIATLLYPVVTHVDKLP
jgi:succinate dehydrogenase hydrophobic anchor subunit